MRSRLRLVFMVCALAACGVLIRAGIAPQESRAGMVTATDCCETGELEVGVDDTPRPAPGQPMDPKVAEASSSAATQPESANVRGAVQLKGNWDLQKPDLTKVVVFLDSNPALDATPTDLPFATVAQKHKAFVPNFTVVQRGTTVEFPNWDDFDHNVFSRSKAAPAFDLDRYPKGQSKARVFEKVGVVQVFCNIHPQMRAMIYVTPNRYFARANSEGEFEISGIPAGQYEIVAWHERCGEQRQAIELMSAEPLEVSFTLQENRQQVIANDNPRKDKAYGIERGLGVKREKLDLPVVEESHPARSEPPR